MRISPKRWAGLLLLAAVGVGLVALVAVVRRPLGRVASTVLHDAFGGVRGDRAFPVETPYAVRRGDPVYRADRADALRPVGYVTRAESTRVFVRLHEAVASDLRLVVHGAPEDLGASIRLALPEATLKALEAEVGVEVKALLEGAVLPALERQLPAFLARVDPRKDAKAKEVLDGLTAEVMARLEPLGEDLAAHVAKDVERRYDLLARLGLLWQMVRGDAEGLKRDLTPVATKSAKAWWADHQAEVLTRVGDAIRAEGEPLKAWLASDVLEAAKEELLQPVLSSEGRRIERAADRLLRRASAAVVEAPDGGFRLPFATVVRARLLEKDSPLLLLERP